MGIDSIIHCSHKKILLMTDVNFAVIWFPYGDDSKEMFPCITRCASEMHLQTERLDELTRRLE